LRGRDQAGPGPPAGTRAPQQPPNPRIWRRWPRAYAEVAVRGDFQRRGGARERRGSVAVRRSWVRIRSITRGWVMKATMLRPAAAGFRERERHGLGLHGRGLLVGASPAPNARVGGSSKTDTPCAEADRAT